MFSCGRAGLLTSAGYRSVLCYVCNPGLKWSTCHDVAERYIFWISNFGRYTTAAGLVRRGANIEDKHSLLWSVACFVGFKALINTDFWRNLLEIPVCVRASQWQLKNCEMKWLYHADWLRRRLCVTVAGFISITISNWHTFELLKWPMIRLTKSGERIAKMGYFYMGPSNALLKSTLKYHSVIVRLQKLVPFIYVLPCIFWLRLPLFLLSRNCVHRHCTTRQFAHISLAKISNFW
jgi:hypothetical protein